MHNIASKDDTIIKVLFRLASLKNEIVCCKEIAGRLPRLGRKLATVSGSKLPNCTLDLSLLKDKLENSVARGQDTLSASDAKAMVMACDNLRLRILSSLLEACPSPLIDPETAQEWKHETIIQEKSGMAWTKIGNTRVILLPELGSSASCDQVACELFTILDASYDSHWIIDFSAVKTTPTIFFMGSLRSYMDKLACARKKLVLLWLRDVLFPPAFTEQLMRAFELRRLGGYLFSSGMIKIN